MTLPSTPETFEQLISNALASSDYKPVWARFVRTRFFAAVRAEAEGADSADGASSAFDVLPGPKDGKPLLLVAQEQAQLGGNGAAAQLSGAEIVRKLAPGVAIGVVLSKGVFTMPAKLVDTLRSKLEAPASRPPAPAASPAMASSPAAPATPAASPTAANPGKFPELNAALPVIDLPPPAVAAPRLPAAPLPPATRPSAPDANALPSLASAAPGLSAFPTLAPEVQPAPVAPAAAAAADWDDDLVDMALLPASHAPAPAPAAAVPPAPAARPAVPAPEQWQLQGDEEEVPATASATAGPAVKPLAPLPAVGGKKATRPLDVQALKPRNVVHAAMGIDFYVPEAWQQRTGSRSLTFLDPATQAKIEVNTMQRADTPLDKWMEIRLPTVTKEYPFLQQVGESYAVSGSEWRGRISAMVTEFRGAKPIDQEEIHYLICCYRTDSMVATITVRVSAALFEENRALYKWLFEQVDIYEPMPAVVTGNRIENTDFAPDPAFFSFNTQGRIGRLRFLAYSMVMYLPFIALGVLMAILPPKLSLLIGIPLVIAMVWMPLRMLVMRMHDFNMSGKWLLGFILLSGAAGAAQRPDLAMGVSGLFWLSMLLVMFIPGNREENAYGYPCGPNPIWVKVLAGLFFAAQLLFGFSAFKAYRTYRSAQISGRPAPNAGSGSMSDAGAGSGTFPGQGRDSGGQTPSQPFSPVDKSFTIDLPGKPFETSVPAGRQGVESIRLYRLNEGEYKYMVQSVVFSRMPDDRAAVLDQVRDNFIRETGAVLVSESPVRIDDLSGRDVRLRRPGVSVQDYRLLFVGSHLYVLLLESPFGKDDPARIRAFMESFRLG